MHWTNLSSTKVIDVDLLVSKRFWSGGGEAEIKPKPKLLFLYPLTVDEATLRQLTFGLKELGRWRLA